MGKKYLVAVDLEGVHGVVGEAYSGLSKTLADYKVATENAVLEINAAVNALFDSGAETVAVWDNHGGGDNLDFSKIDSRIVRVVNPRKPRYERMSFARDFKFDGLVYIGYHAKDGSHNGVLAHTYSSASIQYIKINNRSVGEIEIDAYVAAEHGILPIFLASDDVCVGQAKAMDPDIETVVTKIGKGRNAAEFIDEDTVLKSIYDGVLSAAKRTGVPTKLKFPAKLEKRYTRMEDAAKDIKRLADLGVDVCYGEDAHILEAQLQCISDLEQFL